MSIRNFFFIIFFLVSSYCIKAEQSPYILTFFFKPHFIFEAEPVTDNDLSELVSVPAKIQRKFLKKYLTSTIQQGIYVNYKGQVAISDYNGQIIFPKTSSENKLILVVTPRITPVFLRDEVIHHFKVSKESPAAFYEFKLSTAEPVQWHITEIPLPANRDIPINAVIINAKPKDIAIQTGIFPTQGLPNFILPDILVNPEINRGINSFSFLKVNRYFSPVKKYVRYAPDRYASITL